MRTVDFRNPFSYASRSSAIVLFALLGACSSASSQSGGSQGNHSATAPDLGPNAQPVFNFFVAKGLTDFQAAGIVGNLQQESSLEPTAVQQGGPGHGIAQWSAGGQSGDRWDYDTNDNAEWYASQQHQDVWSLQLQLDFIWYELTNIGYGYSDLRATTNVDDATVVFMQEFEICGDCQTPTRKHYAEEALAAFGSGSGGSNPCANVAGADNGTYCGSSTQSGFAGGPNVSPTTLFICQNGSVAKTSTCSEGCKLEAAGHPDDCYSDPCTHVPAANNGLYCGRSNQTGFAGASSYIVYDCESGRTKGIQTCPWGCFMANPGTNDGCNPDPCTNVSGGNDGAYCGKSNQSGFGGGDPSTLYTCSGGVTTQTQTCTKGCYIANAGTQDGCN
jgi:hypothetical protein